MENITYVELVRVSTNTKRQSLSPDFQREANRRFIEYCGGTIIESFLEEMSGTRANREVFDMAVNRAVETGSVLLVAKLSRLSRAGFSTIAYLDRKKVNYIESTSPNDSSFVKGIKLLQAKEENDERRDNIKRGLEQIKRNIKKNGFHISKSGRRITSLGSPGNLTKEGLKKSAETRLKKALENKNNLRAKAMIELLVKQRMSLKEIANHLNSKGFRTSTGKEFKSMTVSNIADMYGIHREKTIHKKRERKKKPKVGYEKPLRYNSEGHLIAYGCYYRICWKDPGLKFRLLRVRKDIAYLKYGKEIMAEVDDIEFIETEENKKKASKFYYRKQGVQDYVRSEAVSIK